MATTKTSTSFDRAKIMKIISLCLLGIGIILAIIGCFGDVFKVSTSAAGQSMSQSMSISYFFDEAWDLLKSYESLSDSAHGILLFEILIHLFSFIACVAVVIGFSILSVVRISGNNRLNLNVKKIATMLLVGILPYVMITSFVCYSSVSANVQSEIVYNADQTVSFGWGLILLIISSFILIASSCVYQMSEKNNTNSMISVGLEHVMMVLFGFIAIFGFGGAIKCSMVATGGSEVVKSNIFALIESYYIITGRPLEEGAPKLSSSIIGCSIVAMIAMLVMIVLVIFIITKEDKKKGIINSSLFVALSIFAGVLSMVAFNKYISDGTGGTAGVNVKFGSAFIVDIVLGILAIVAGAISYNLDLKGSPKKIEAPKEK